jgi:hypothetical protein
MPLPTLTVVKERKLAELIAPPKGSSVLEASGVFAKGDHFYVIFDNIRRVARIDRSLAPGHGLHRWFGTRREGEGYEDIAYSPELKRFYLLIEAEKHHDGTFKPLIDECDEQGRVRGRRWVNIAFQKRNTGLEGLAAIRWKGKDYLLALCEGNRCRAGRAGRKGGGGRIHVLVRKGGHWESVARIKLPRSVDFEDYALLLYPSYPDESVRPLLLSLIQMEWDRGEPNGYANHMTDDPLPGTPAHKVLIEMAYGDHQVSNVATEVEARTIGAPLRRPALDPGRAPSAFAGFFPQLPTLGPLTGPAAHGNGFFVWDIGPKRPDGMGGFLGTDSAPITNTAPNDSYGVDPHDTVIDTSAAVRHQIAQFIKPHGTIVPVCGHHPCYAAGWDGPGS